MELAVLLDALRRVGLAAARSPAAVRSELDAAIRRVAPAIDAVLFFDEAEGELVCTAASGMRVLYFGGVRLAIDARTLPGLARIRGRRVLLGEDGLRGFHPADGFALAVPLGAASVVYAAGRYAVGAAAREAIVTLIDQAAFAYGLACEREAYLERAEYDALTGLLTPRALRERLAATIERARFAPLARVALAFVDTDRFKDWNDSYGHAGGDALLRALAQTLRDAAYGGDDLAARNGGDEFCLVFTDTEKSRAIERAQALRRAIAALDLDALRPARATVRVAITASIGVAAYPADARTPHALLERADEAMYHSKRGGRDAVSYYDAGGALVLLPGDGDADGDGDGDGEGVGGGTHGCATIST